MNQSKPKRMPLSNTIKLRDDIAPNIEAFHVNSIAKFIDCCSVIAHHVRNRQAVIVKIEKVNKNDDMS